MIYDRESYIQEENPVECELKNLFKLNDCRAIFDTAPVAEVIKQASFTERLISKLKKIFS